MRLPNLNLFQRNFVSIVVTSNKVLIAKLSNNKEKVEIFTQQNIPPGTIVGYRVVNKEKLVEIIRSAWHEAKIHDKFVGVVVPEFATYTKTLELPSLTDTEISEALGWRIQEYLPAPVEDVVIDWKIINRTEEKSKILVVAILKEVLMGYMDAIGSAGLSPLVVETPSLSIARLTFGETGGKLIIYLSSPEALIIIAEGNQIIASSVVSVSNINIVVSTAQQMISHYGEVEVEKVLVGGTGITKDLISNLHYNLGRVVQYLDYQIKGLAPQQAQDYLLALSLQYKDPVEPASDKTINLLPTEWAETYRKKLVLLKTWTLTLITSIVTWSIFLSAFSIVMLITFQREALSRQVGTVDVLEFNQTVAQVNQINGLANTVIDIDNKSRSFQEVFNLVYSLIPPNVTVTSIALNIENGAITINGIPTNNTDLIELSENIKANPDIRNIVIPVEMLVPGYNQPFSFNSFYEPYFKPEARTNVKLNL